VSFPAFDLAKDLALARGGRGPGDDDDPRTLRRRIALIAWFPGAFLVWLLALSLGSWVVGVVGIIVLVIGLWLFAERGDLILALVRRRLPRTGDR
jgi:hypothetical protein